MIDERIAYYIQGIFVWNIVLFWFLKKVESNVFLFDEKFETPSLYKKGFIGILSLFLIVLFIVFSEEYQLPSIVNVSHQMISGKISTYEKRERNSGGYTIWRTRNHRITLEKDSGEEVYIKVTRAPDMEVGMQIEVRLYEARDMVPVVTRIDGQRTEIYQKERGVTRTEKALVFAIYPFLGFLLIKSLNRQYATIGNRQCGKRWYYGGVASILLWIIVAAVGIKGEYDALLMGDLLVIANAIIYVCLFRLTWLVHPEDSKRLVEILKGHYECNATIELERIPETEVQGYCTYKRDRLEEELSILWIVEPVAILLTVAVYILWNNKWKWLVITVLFVLAIMILIIKVRTFRRNSVALKKAMVSGLEYAQVTFDIGELKKYRGTDGEIIWAKMRFDDDGELEDGDMAIAIRAVGTNVVFMEQEKKLSDILEGRILEEK